MKKIITAVLVSIVVVVFTFSTGLWLGISYEPFKNYISNIFRESAIKYLPEEAESEFSIEPLNETINLVSEDALDEKSKEELLVEAIKGVLSSLDDEYTGYFTAEEYEDFSELMISGTMSGIGVIVEQKEIDDEKQVIVVRTLEDTPAYRAGIKDRDIIIEVNGIDIKGMTLEKVVTMITGEEGTDVDLKIYRPSDDSTIELTITRERFNIPVLTSGMIADDIGYIYYGKFQGTGAQQLDDEIQKLIDNGAEGLILDLRDNLGGLLSDAVKVCDLFLNEGKIVIIGERSEDKDVVNEFIAGKGKYTEIPLLVLINEFSASASEVVAGALKDNNRALLIGERSFGKGLVQSIYELSDGSAIEFTIEKYFLPSGLSIEGIGIEPDILVESEPDSEEDLQLGRAVEEMKILLSES
jgi:carboxyl-terminal processing protease